MQAVILAAGKGKRLYPFTPNRSKAMAPIAGIPIIGRVTQNLIDSGISNFTFVVSSEDTEVQDYISKNFPKVNKTFVIQEKQLGMTHAVLTASQHITEKFTLSACDSIFPPEFVSKFVNFLYKEAKHGLLTLKEIPDEKVQRMGIVSLNSEGLIEKIVEKPRLEDAPSRIASFPMYGFSTDIISLMKKVKPSSRGDYELQDAIQLLIDAFGPIPGLFTPERLEVTSLEDLYILNMRFLKQSNNSIVKTDVTTRIIDPVIIEEKVTIGAGCSIGPNVYIEEGTVIPDNCNISDSVILKTAKITEVNISGEMLL